MTVALLRAVNVAGHKPVSMAELRAMAEKMGLKNVATILQSGNLLFDAPHPPLRGTLRLAPLAQGRPLSPLRGARDLEKRGAGDVAGRGPSPRVRGERGPEQSDGLDEGRALEAQLESKLGTDVFVRTQAEMDTIVRNNPFPGEAKNDPGRLVVLFLKQSADGSVLQKAIKGREIARGKGREIYVYYPDGQGRSKLTNALIEKTLGTRATARNWNTVLKLQHGLER